MANHYSGKRAAGRKPVGKRALSLLMALVMSLSLVQITAFAENDTAADKTQVVEAGGIAYYDKNGMKLEPATGSGEPGNWVVKVERTLKETGTENLLDVDLKVTTKDNTVSTDAEAAAVLVIDTSGSMADCATCGKGENDRNHEGQPVWKCPVGDTTLGSGPLVYLPQVRLQWLGSYACERWTQSCLSVSSGAGAVCGQFLCGKLCQECCW